MADRSEAQIEQVKAVNHHLWLTLNLVEEGAIIIQPGPLKGSGPKIVFNNKGFEEITGLTGKELVGQPISKIYPGEDLSTLYSHIEASVDSDSICRIDSGVLRSDRSMRKCRWKVKPVQSKGQLLNIILTAIPEEDSPSLAAPLPKESAAPSLKQPVTRTGQSAKPPISGEQKDQFLERNRLESLAMLSGGIAHDFRNSLTAIIANLSMAKPFAQPGSELEKHLEDVNSAAEEARELTSHLLAFARGGKPKREETDIARLVKESIQLATYGASVKCRVTMDDELWHSEVDRTQIKQVLNNLIINAWQAMPGGGTIRLTAENIDVTSSMNVDLKPGSYVALAVRDRGCGISQENMRKIFEPFFTTKEFGSGIGLATCYRVVKQHDGDITVRSKENVGTEFKVFIPAFKAGEKAAKKKKVVQKDELIYGTGRVLVVDDQGSVRNVASMILKKLGYTVDTASDGESAVKMYDSARKDGDPFLTILMDMTLPGGMNGEEAFYEMRRLDPQVRAIASSGFFEDDAHGTFRELGFANILPKPYSASVLSKIIHSSIHDPLPS